MKLVNIYNAWVISARKMCWIQKWKELDTYLPVWIEPGTYGPEIIIIIIIHFLEFIQGKTLTNPNASASSHQTFPQLLVRFSIASVLKLKSTIKYE